MHMYVLQVSNNKVCHLCFKFPKEDVFSFLFNISGYPLWFKSLFSLTNYKELKITNVIGVPNSKKETC